MSEEVAALQREFSRHIRDPETFPLPEGIEPRRMRIYNELVYNTIEGFVASGFPVLRSLFGAGDWQVLVRRFVSSHACRTPYFLEISREFLDFLQSEPEICGALRPFAPELAHYEWVELALDVAEDEVVAAGVDPEGDPMPRVPVLSPLAWALSYRFPVHRISREFQPTRASQVPNCLIVYRNREDAVKFIESNPVTLRMLALMEGATLTGQQICAAIAGELGMDPVRLRGPGLETLARLQQLGIIAGTLVGAQHSG